RTEGDPLMIASELRARIHELAPEMPVYGVRSMEQTIQGMNGLFLYGVGAKLAGAMGGLGLLLAVIGVYGVISYDVGQRAKEIGIRVAIGAQPEEIRRMISRRTLRIVLVGVPFGLFAAFGVGQLLSDFLLGIPGTDPVTYAAATLVLVCA